MTTSIIKQIETNDCDFELHNYTGICPKNVYEINPIGVNCGYNCQYCLVNNGQHNVIEVISNYDKHVYNFIEAKRAEKLFLYFSPKSEAFQKATLETGVAHNIIKSFIKHFNKYPDSNIRLFIASKAGVEQLNHKYKGESIISLLSQLKGKIQFNTSIGLMPEQIRLMVEKDAPTIEDRLEAVLLLQSKGILSEAVLMQPIITTFCTEIAIAELCEKFTKCGIKNVKPEFLTTNTQNILLVGKIIKDIHGEKEEKDFYDCYFKTENQTHIKHNNRLAPDRNICNEKLDMISKICKAHNISVSICYWVRKELMVQEIDIPIINKNNYECLGYKQSMFS